jgi:hypothetical protein
MSSQFFMHIQGSTIKPQLDSHNLFPKRNSPSALKTDRERKERILSFQTIPIKSKKKRTPRHQSQKKQTHNVQLLPSQCLPDKRNPRPPLRLRNRAAASPVPPARPATVADRDRISARVETPCGRAARAAGELGLAEARPGVGRAWRDGRDRDAEVQRLVSWWYLEKKGWEAGLPRRSTHGRTSCDWHSGCAGPFQDWVHGKIIERLTAGRSCSRSCVAR